jgi:hypothetical protein
MITEQGDPGQAPAIATSGNIGVQLLDLAAPDLAGIDVLFLNNPSNSGYGAEFTASLADVFDWVDDGGVLVFHDRYVDPAETVLPGGATFNIVRETSGDTAQIEVIDDTTLVTDGPGGLIDDSSLDGGTLSSHGFAVLGSLPSDGTFILSRTDPTEIVTFSYCYGDGGVVYSSIPLDAYLGGGLGGNMDIYAANVIEYGAEEVCAVEPTPTPTPTSTPRPLPTARPQVGGAAAGIVSAITTGVQNSQQVFGADPTAVGIAPPSTGTGVITPPSTGDAGLEESGNASVLLVGGLVLGALVVLTAARRLARRGL